MKKNAFITISVLIALFIIAEYGVYQRILLPYYAGYQEAMPGNGLRDAGLFTTVILSIFAPILVAASIHRVIGAMLALPCMLAFASFQVIGMFWPHKIRLKWSLFCFFLCAQCVIGYLSIPLLENAY